MDNIQRQEKMDDFLTAENMISIWKNIDKVEEFYKMIAGPIAELDLLNLFRKY